MAYTGLLFLSASQVLLLCATAFTPANVGPHSGPAGLESLLSSLKTSEPSEVAQQEGGTKGLRFETLESTSLALCLSKSSHYQLNGI